MSFPFQNKLRYGSIIFLYKALYYVKIFQFFSLINNLQFYLICFYRMVNGVFCLFFFWYFFFFWLCGLLFFWFTFILVCNLCGFFLCVLISFFCVCVFFLVYFKLFWVWLHGIYLGILLCECVCLFFGCTL